MNILVVCTANVCRSPMAAALLGALDAPLRIRSAGTRAVAGQPIHPYAAAALHSAGFPDAASHRSLPLLPSMLQEADLVLCMTGEHRQDIIGASPESAGRVKLFGAGRGIEIEDPVGGSPDAFDRCLLTLAQCAAGWLAPFLALARSPR
jgi:protein-tyrosine phosphatase